MSSETMQQSATKIRLAEEEEEAEKEEHSDDNQEEEEESLLDRYNKALDSNPVLTKALTAAFVQGLGSIIGSILSSSSSKQQHQHARVIGAKQQQKSKIDWTNVFAFALHGGLINGPVGHYWFEYLSKHGPKSKSYSTLLDQLVVQPPLLVFMFIFLDITKKALGEIQPSYKRTMDIVGPTIVSSWRFWPLAVYCTFRYLKKKHYTVALNLCSIAWTIYLSKGKQQQSGKK